MQSSLLLLEIDVLISGWKKEHRKRNVEWALGQVELSEFFMSKHNQLAMWLRTLSNSKPGKLGKYWPPNANHQILASMISGIKAVRRYISEACRICAYLRSSVFRGDNPGWRDALCNAAKDIPALWKLVESDPRVREIFYPQDSKTSPPTVNAFVMARDSLVAEHLTQVRRVVDNQRKKELRRRRKKRSLFQDLDDLTTEDIVTALTRTEVVEKSRAEQEQALARFPVRTRRILKYRADGLKLKEIGEIVGLSKSRVSEIISDATEELASLLFRRPS